MKQYDISEDDAINYIYGLLHSKEFIEKYSHNLTKDIPHIPLVKHKDQYITIGKKLVDLHLHYESVTPYDKVKIIYNGTPTYRVSKMQFGKKVNPKTGKQEKDRSVIIFNNSITISNIPEKAYRYIINGESAIKLIMDQYQIKTDTRSGSGIVDDPNDYSDDPKYIFNLLLRIITVSLKTIDLINQLPKFEVKDD